MLGLFNELSEKEKLARKLIAKISSGYLGNPLDLIRDDVGLVFSWSLIVDLALENKKIHKFFEHNIALNEYWAMHLESKGYISFPFYSVDGERPHTTFKQFKGAYFWGKYHLLKNIDLSEAAKMLDQACQCNIYDAWLEKIFILRVRFIEGREQAALDSLLDALLTFSKVFWSVGFLFSGTLLIEVAAVQFMREASVNEWSPVLLAGIYNLYLGMCLLDEEYSKVLIENIYRKEGWVKIFENYTDQWEEDTADGIKKYFHNFISKVFKINNIDLYFDPISIRAAEDAKSIRDKFAILSIHANEEIEESNDSENEEKSTYRIVRR